MSHQAAPRRVGPVYRISRALILFVYGFAIACIVILATAFFLQLFNANTTAPFVDWVYRAARRIMQPFRGIFPSVEGEQGSVFDVSMLFAMFMYGLLALGANGLIAWIDRKIAAIRYEAMFRPAATPTASSDVVTIRLRLRPRLRPLLRPRPRPSRPPRRRRGRLRRCRDRRSERTTSHPPRSSRAHRAKEW